MLENIGKYPLEGFIQTDDIHGNKYPVWILNHDKIRASISQGEKSKKYYVFVTIPGEPELLLNSYKKLETASKNLKKYIKEKGF